MIRLSEAVRLGTTLVPPVYGPLFKRNWCGTVIGACRLGATAMAAGYKPSRLGNMESDLRSVGNFFYQTWPDLYMMWPQIGIMHEYDHMTADEIADCLEAYEQPVSQPSTTLEEVS